jgi:hypothetical protein
MADYARTIVRFKDGLVEGVRHNDHHREPA